MASKRHRTLRNVTFAITADSGQMEKQAMLLCKSIERYYSSPQIINFIPESSINDLNNTTKRYFEETTTVVTDEIPMRNYQTSAKLQSFVEAAKIADYNYIAMLDTDTVLLSPITIPATQADLYLKPVDVGAQYWGSSKSLSDWKKLFEWFDVPFPSQRVQSTIDKRLVLPYWNAGVVITNDDALPLRLLRMTKRLANDDLLGREEDVFLDQLSLAILSETKNVSRISELQNYPLNARLTCPKEVQLIHYRDFQNLLRIPNPNVRRKLNSLGLRINNYDCLDVSDILMNLIYSHSGRYLSYYQKVLIWKYLFK